MEPNISFREYIRWVPDERTEPTSTLVLTSPEKRFVDIRILLPTNETDDEEGISSVVPSSRLDWAFAGISSSVVTKDSAGEEYAHSKWHHWVDSRTRDAESITDEGDMFPQADGATVEIGEMVNPATGRMTEYEECWRDLEAITTDTGLDDGEEKKMCIVLVLQDDEISARGMVVRVGQFCQGVLRVGEYFTAERWQWEEESGWMRKARIGDLWVPCGVILEGESVKLEGEVEYGEYVWQVVEMSEF